MRDDSVTHTPGEFTEDILNNAPDREGNYLKVKKIL
jgi:Asp-tRNA(Asn)/Glu-tRNA(Gln) amidotransferase C subunit